MIAREVETPFYIESSTRPNQLHPTFPKWVIFVLRRLELKVDNVIIINLFALISFLLSDWQLKKNELPKIAINLTQIKESILFF